MKKLSPEKQEMFIKEATPVLESVRLDLVPIVEAGEMVQACVFILGVEGEPKFLLLQPYIDKDKDVAAEMMQKIQSTPGVLATLFVSESWISKYTKEEFEAAGGRENLIPPSKHPDRKEGVVFLLETRVGALFAECEIFRNPDRLGPLNIHADSLNEPPPEGRFSGGFKLQTAAPNLDSISNYFKSQGKL